jgi:hypothetical protein
MSADHFKADDSTEPEELAARRFAYAASAELKINTRIELTGATLIRLPGGFKIVRTSDAGR